MGSLTRVAKPVTSSLASVSHDSVSLSPRRFISELGIMLGDGFVDIDIDGCRDKKAGSLSSLAEEIMQEMNTLYRR